MVSHGHRSAETTETTKKMDKKQFAAKVGAPQQFSPQERGWLRAMMAKYPYSSAVSTLALLADHAHGFDTPAQRRATSLAMCDSRNLETMLAAARTPDNPADESQVDILNEINTFQEVSFKTAPKSVILSNFLKDGPAEAMERVRAELPTPHDDDKKSLRADESLASETLAIILEKQGKYDKAADIYRKLLAANPEKNSIFAPRIKELQNRINNK